MATTPRTRPPTMAPPAKGGSRRLGPPSPPKGDFPTRPFTRPGTAKSGGYGGKGAAAPARPRTSPSMRKGFSQMPKGGVGLGKGPVSTASKPPSFRPPSR